VSEVRLALLHACVWLDEELLREKEWIGELAASEATELAAREVVS
jgi:hypothetical protein